MEVYLDNSATTQPVEVAITAINQTLITHYGNPSSLHRRGLDAERTVKTARRQIAAALGVAEHELLFTSGGTESNNLAIWGLLENLKAPKRPLVTTQIEHASVLNIFKHLEKTGHRVIYLKVDSHGQVELDAVEQALRERPALISIMSVNNEIGALQPVAEIAQLLTGMDEKVLLHTDAVQAFGKVALNPAQLGVDALSVSSHKIHGPKGVGALYLRKGVRIRPLFLGGSQEQAFRPGTENVPGIAGMGAAAAWSQELLPTHQTRFNQLKQTLIDGVENAIPGVTINSPVTPEFAPHILSLSFKGIRGEVLLHALEQDGIYIGTRSACSSRKKSHSHVLQALGLTPEEIEGTIRISFGGFNHRSEMAYVLERLQHHVATIRRVTGWREK